MDREPLENPEPIPLRRIEDELALVLHGNQASEDHTVHAARMSNLVIFCNDEKRAQDVQETIPRIVDVHPARVFLALHTPSEQAEPVTGSVTAWCNLGAGKRQICSEQVNLNAGGRSAEPLIYAIRGLLIGDLPTNLWWACEVPPALAGSLVNEAAESVQQIIYDSIGWREPARGVAAMGAWVAAMERDGKGGRRYRVISDLNWRRLKFWRRILTQALDPNVLPGALESITEIQVEHGPHAVVQAWLLMAWFAARLGWKVRRGRIDQGVEIAWEVQAPHGKVAVSIDRLSDGPSEVRRVQVHCRLGGKPGILNVLTQGEDRLVVIPEGQEAAARTLTIQPQSTSELVARQLSDRERDPVFREAMAHAETFARSVLG